MKRLGRVLACLALILAGAGLIFWPQEAAEAAKEGLRLCGGVIIPSLFPFFVLSSMAVSLGLAQLMGQLLAPLMGPLFRVGRAGAGALALGLIGGYPVGARTVRQLYESGQCSRDEAERLLAFCNNCGPAFILGVTGAGVFGSAEIGALLLAGHVLGACSVGIVFRRYGADRKSAAPPAVIHSVSLPSAFTQAVKSGLMSTLNVCGYVVLFSVLLRFLTRLGALEPFAGLPNGKALASGILELSSGISALSSGAGGIAAAAFLLAFGGLSVQCQTLSMLEGSGLDPRPELLGKLLHGLFAALWTWGLLRLFPQAAETLAPAVLPAAQTGWNWLSLGITGGSWGIFLLIFWSVVGFHSGKRRRKRV